MTKWEYLTAPILTHAAKQILDNFGADGWELVQIAPGMNPENLVGYFKRPLAVTAVRRRSGWPSSGSPCRRSRRRWRRTSRRCAAATRSSPPASCRCGPVS